MSTTEIAAGSLPELAAGLAVVVPTIPGLARVSPTFLVEIATIAFGVGLVLYGTTTLAQISRVLGVAPCGAKPERSPRNSQSNGRNLS